MIKDLGKIKGVELGSRLLTDGKMSMISKKNLIFRKLIRMTT